MMDSPITILLVDDHQIFRDGLKGILQGVPGIEVIGEASDGWEAWEWMTENQVDLIVTDIQMSPMDGIAFTERVKLNLPDQRVLVLSMYDDVSVVQRIFEVEADGYILKNSGRDEFLTAINRIHEGSSFYNREVMDILMQDLPKVKQSTDLPEILTARELEILTMICEELSTKEIADKLFLSPRTVETHRKNILQKTGVKTLVGLVKLAFASNILHS